MIDLNMLIEEDKEVSEALKKLIACRIEFDFEALNNMDDDLYEIVKPFYEKACKEAVMEHVSKAAKGFTGEKKEAQIPIKEIVETAIAKAVEAFNEDNQSIGIYWFTVLNHLAENVETKEDARNKILQLANMAIWKEGN